MKVWVLQDIDFDSQTSRIFSVTTSIANLKTDACRLVENNLQGEDDSDHLIAAFKAIRDLKDDLTTQVVRYGGDFQSFRVDLAEISE